ncbi:MAG: sugar phosphate isomerase/epimerase [Acidobacteria bacterium]|nr:sugar phosphate isomerase/epimerase [Acidobacteriota bacterium]
MHNQIDRRTFLASLGAASLAGAPLGLPLGCQTYPVREAIGKDFAGTLRQLAGIGYKSIELCSPHGYAKSGYGALLEMKPGEIRRQIGEAGLVCESCHYQLREFKDNVGETIAYAKQLGLKQLVLASFSLRNATLAQWTQAARDFNRAAEQVHKAGLQAAFHNHNVEFETLEGVVIYDRLLSEMDPKLVKLQFQTWVVSMGVDPVAMVEKHASRISSLHLQDYVPGSKGMAAIGKGSIDWKRFFAAARKGGVKNYYVEMDLNLMRDSVPYLQSLKA